MVNIETREVPSIHDAKELIENPPEKFTVTDLIDYAVALIMVSSELEEVQNELMRIQGLKYGPNGEKPLELTVNSAERSK